MPGMVSKMVGMAPTTASVSHSDVITWRCRRKIPSSANQTMNGPTTRTRTIGVVSPDSTFCGSMACWSPSQPASGSSQTRLVSVNVPMRTVRPMARSGTRSMPWPLRMIVIASVPAASMAASVAMTVTPSTNGAAMQRPAHGSQMRRVDGRVQW